MPKTIYHNVKKVISWSCFCCVPVTVMVSNNCLLYLLVREWGFNEVTSSLYTDHKMNSGLFCSDQHDRTCLITISPNLLRSASAARCTYRNAESLRNPRSPLAVTHRWTSKQRCDILGPTAAAWTKQVAWASLRARQEEVIFSFKLIDDQEVFPLLFYLI